MAQTLTPNHSQAFENTSSSVAASQMRNALNALADTVSDTEQKKVDRCIPKSQSLQWLML